MSASPGSWTARRRPVRAVDPVRGHGSNGPRFARFAAAMEAAPPPEAQVLPETPTAAPTLVRPVARQAAGPTVVPSAAVPPVAVAQRPAPMPAGPPDDDPVVDEGPAPDDGPVGAPTDAPLDRALDGPERGMSATVTPRRPVIDGALRGAIPWLGIGSWVLFCGALFVSLLGWPDQTALDRVAGIWSGDDPPQAVAHRTPEAATGQAAPTAAAPHLPPRKMTPGTAGGQAGPEPAEAASDPGPRRVREPGGPPVPQFKPRIDGVAAKFSSAFFEIGNQLQRQGDFDAALHMRRQGTKLDPWREPGARDS